MDTNKKRCSLCNVETTPKNWATHLKSQKYMRLDPNRTIQPKRQEGLELYNHKTHNVVIYVVLKSLIKVGQYI